MILSLNLNQWVIDEWLSGILSSIDVNNDRE